MQTTLVQWLLVDKHVKLINILAECQSPELNLILFIFLYEKKKQFCTVVYLSDYHYFIKIKVK